MSAVPCILILVAALGQQSSLMIGMADIPAGSFVMGNDVSPLWDQKPLHAVTLSQPFRISTSEITLEQFRQFRPKWKQASSEGFAWGIPWYDAVAFCKWLSREEGMPYRLPTEAEWEYVCRSADAFGVGNMANEVREWCSDWYGPYLAGAATDPVGPASGMARVVRGGVLDVLDGKFECLPRSEYDQPAYRAGLPPAFGVSLSGSGGEAGDDGANVCGAHHVGIRIVQGAPPQTPRVVFEPAFFGRGIKKIEASAQTGPDKEHPYFRKRFLLPSPPETVVDRANMESHKKRIDAAGLDPALRGHNHSPALEVCDNGDLLLVIFTSYTEYEPEMSLMASRLRFGADTWDMPCCLVDCPGVCDNTPLLWKDDGKIYLFWAWSRAEGAFPFQWIVSEDNGASWSEARFPRFTGPIGPHSRQPINRAFRGTDGTIYLPSDGIGGTSVLWGSRDNLETWFDTGGRSAGRHTVYCTLKDGRLLGMGGKNTDIEGYMPKAVSSDGGLTWTAGKSSFPALAVNQRPSLLRLQSGRLFFASDFQKREGIRPEGASEAGSFVALSDDDGDTWRIKKLPGAQEHESGPGFFNALPGATTLGYSVARQAPNGVIHLITTMNQPCLHFELNEAWILSGEPDQKTDQELMANTASAVAEVRDFKDSFDDGAPKATWSAGRGNDGRYLLHGTETWYYPGGGKQYEAHYALGRKTGTETLWRVDGSRAWAWDHQADGSSRWTQWWEQGGTKAESTWSGFHAVGMARTWNRDGSLALEVDMSSE